MEKHTPAGQIENQIPNSEKRLWVIPDIELIHSAEIHGATLPSIPESQHIGPLIGSQS